MKDSEQNNYVILFMFVLQEITIMRQPGDKLGISIQGGAGSRCGNPYDGSDEGIFISQAILIVLFCLPLSTSLFTI